MSTVYDLLATLGIDTSDYHAGLQDAEGESDRFSTTISGLGAVGGGILSAGLMAGGVAAAFLGTELVGAVGEATEAQDNLVLLDTIIGNTGDTTGVTMDMVNGLANSFTTLTKYSDDEILSAEGVIGRFDQINSESFPQALSLSMDLATVMKTDLSSAALMVAKALAVPGEGLMRLKQAGVAFSDEETAMIQKMMDAGDTAGAQAFIMQTLEGAIGGAAEAAGGTASGQWKIFKNQIDNILETVGTGLLPAITDLGTTLSDYVARPETQVIIQGIADALGNFANQVISWLPTVVFWIQSVFGWMMDNQGLIIGVLAAMGVAVGVFLYTSAAAAIAAAGGFAALWASIWPVIAVLAAVVAVVWLLYEAWTNNWGGIRDALTAAWVQIQPVLQQLWSWFKDYLAFAIQFYTDLWTYVLLPAILQVWAWVQANLFPIFEVLKTWFIAYLAVAITYWSNLWTNVLLPVLLIVWGYITNDLLPLFMAVANFLSAVFGLVIQVFSALWTNVLLPVLTAVWNFLQTSVFPLFMAISNFLGAVFSLVLTALAGLWQNVLLPALKVVTDWIGDKLHPIFVVLSNFVNDHVMPAITALGGWLSDHLAPAFETIGDAISGVIDWFNSMADAIRNFKLPDWLTPGSPTPFETGLWGINDALQAINQTGTPDIFGAQNVSGGGAGGGDTYINVTPHYYRGSEPTLMEELKLIGALA